MSNDSATLRLVSETPNGKRKGRGPWDRLRAIANHCRALVERSASDRAQLKERETRIERLYIVQDALLDKLPDDMRDKIQETGAQIAEYMTPEEFGAMLVRIENVRKAQ